MVEEIPRYYRFRHQQYHVGLKYHELSVKTGIEDVRNLPHDAFPRRLNQDRDTKSCNEPIVVPSTSEKFLKKSV